MLKISTVSILLLFSALILVNLPVYAQELPPTSDIPKESKHCMSTRYDNGTVIQQCQLVDSHTGQPINETNANPSNVNLQRFNSKQFVNSLSKDQYGILLSEDLNSSPRFIPPKSVVWYNDIGSSVMLSSKLFNNVTILRDQNFSYTFDTPGVYWVHVNGTLAKEMIQVYDLVNDYMFNL